MVNVKIKTATGTRIKTRKTDVKVLKAKVVPMVRH